ncbi:MAG: hypothetical protein V4560_15515 [Bacteroidota bacterium]
MIKYQLINLISSQSFNPTDHGSDRRLQASAALGVVADTGLCLMPAGV